MVGIVDDTIRSIMMSDWVEVAAVVGIAASIVVAVYGLAVI